MTHGMLTADPACMGQDVRRYFLVYAIELDSCMQASVTGHFRMITHLLYFSSKIMSHLLLLLFHF